MTFKELLDNSGKTRYWLSKQTGIAKGTLDRYYLEKSKIQNMSLISADKISTALGMKLEEFWEATKE